MIDNVAQRTSDDSHSAEQCSKSKYLLFPDKFLVTITIRGYEPEVNRRNG